MKKIVTASIVLLMILYYCTSCGPSHYLKKAERALKKAEQLGANIKSDTVFTKIKFHVPGVSVNFTHQPLVIGKPMIFEKDSVKTEVLISKGNPGKPDTVYVSTKCPDQEVEKEVATAVSQEIKSGATTWDIIILAIAAAAVGYVVRWISK